MCLSKGDRNTDYFHNFPSHKNTHTILEIKNYNDIKVPTFKQIVEVGNEHFKKHYKDQKESINLRKKRKKFLS